MCTALFAAGSGVAPLPPWSLNLQLGAAPWIRLQWTNQIWACSEPGVDTKQNLLVGRNEMLALGREGVTFAPRSREAHIWAVIRWWLSYRGRQGAGSRYCGDRVRVLQPPKTSLAPEIPEQTGLLFLPIESYVRLVWWPKPLTPAGRSR